MRSEGIVLANASSFVKRTLINAICCLNGQLYLDGQPDLVPAFSLDVQLDLDEPFHLVLLVQLVLVCHWLFI